MAPIFKLDPMMGEQPLLKAFIIIILGGLGSIPGAIFGGLILGLIDSVVATALGAEPAFLLSFVFIILLLLFRPTGLFGHAPNTVIPVGLGIGVLLALLLPLAVERLLYVHLFALVFTNVILASSLRLSLMCGQLNIGHSGFMSLGAYTSALLAKNLGVPFEFPCCPGRYSLHRRASHRVSSLRLRGVYFAMVTVAFVEAIRLIAQIWVSLTMA